MVCDLPPEHGLGVVEDVGHQVLEHRETMALEQFVEPLLDHDAGAILRVYVGEALAPGAHVVFDQGRDRPIEFRAAEDSHRRNADAFGIAIERARIEAARQRAANIGPVTGAAIERDQRALEEDRPDQLHVVGVDAAGIRIVEDVDVARLHVLEPVEHDRNGRLERADMRGLVSIAVADQPTFGVENRAGMVVAFADGRRVGEAGDDLAALVAHAAERVLQDLEGDRIKPHRPPPCKSG